MKKGTKILVFTILGLVLFAILLNFVAADPLIEAIKNAFSNPASVGVQKFLFGVLLALLIWSILDFTGLISSDGVRWVISAIVAYLGVAYLTPSEIWATITSYSALGMTVLFLFPTAILFIFSIRAIEKGNVMDITLQYVMWIVYFIFLLLKFIAGIFSNEISMNESTTYGYLAAIIISGIATIGNKQLRRFFLKTITEAESETLHKKFTEAKASIREHARETEELTDTSTHD